MCEAVIRPRSSSLCSSAPLALFSPAGNLAVPALGARPRRVVEDQAALGAGASPQPARFDAAKLFDDPPGQYRRGGSGLPEHDCLKPAGGRRAKLGPSGALGRESVEPSERGSVPSTTPAAILPAWRARRRSPSSSPASTERPRNAFSIRVADSARSNGSSATGRRLPTGRRGRPAFADRRRTGVPDDPDPRRSRARDSRRNRACLARSPV